MYDYFLLTMPKGLGECQDLCLAAESVTCRSYQDLLRLSVSGGRCYLTKAKMHMDGVIKQEDNS
jgi:hypothetical protein